MQREIMQTADGSVTIAIPAMQVTYHSKHGAMQESMHVFIEAGLRPLLNKHDTLEVFEMGFGTGLNAILTVVEATVQQQKISYHTVEAYPLEAPIISSLNYAAQLQSATDEPQELLPVRVSPAPYIPLPVWPDTKDKSASLPSLQAVFEQLHTCVWHQQVSVTAGFTITKYETSLFSLPQEHDLNNRFHLIYYDAFAPSAQPLLWTAETFTLLYNMLQEGGILVTYCSKSVVRRAMQAAGFTVEKIPGPLGKREMVRAKKTAGM